VTTPVIVFSDSPSSNSGLARIARDICTRVHQHLADDFRICSLGYGSPGSCKLPFPQYHWQERGDFIPTELPYVWRDFCQDDNGILFTIGDIQRFLPLADTAFCQDRVFGQWMSDKRKDGKLKLWGYFPIDAHNKDGKLSPQLAHTLTHYDRILVPSKWAAEIVEKTLPGRKVDVLPHGIDRSVFWPRPKEESRDVIGAILHDNLQWPKDRIDISEDALWIGVVATNQQRKDWGLAIEVVAELKKDRPVFLWAHTNRLKNDNGWSILELISDFNLLQCSMVTAGNVTDEVMATAYSAMDMTLGIGRGEGFSFTAFESLFCGAPHFASSYGAHAEYMDEFHAIPPSSLRLEGPLNLMRPVADKTTWAEWIVDRGNMQMMRPDELDWDNLWPNFERWFMEGK
jgi:glycosyltransferase involved in cell wall biosynthesis